MQIICWPLSSWRITALLKGKVVVEKRRPKSIHQFNQCRRHFLLHRFLSVLKRDPYINSVSCIWFVLLDWTFWYIPPTITLSNICYQKETLYIFTYIILLLRNPTFCCPFGWQLWPKYVNLFRTNISSYWPTFSHSHLRCIKRVLWLRQSPNHY